VCETIRVIDKKTEAEKIIRSSVFVMVIPPLIGIDPAMVDGVLVVAVIQSRQNYVLKYRFCSTPM
jgi:hypothetical protein